jgi:hypothetical protein
MKWTSISWNQYWYLIFKNVLRANQTVQLLLFLYSLIMINEMDHTDNLIDTIGFFP